MQSKEITTICLLRKQLIHNDEGVCKYFFSNMYLLAIVSLHVSKFKTANLDKIIAFTNSFNLVEFPKVHYGEALKFKAILACTIKCMP